MEEMLRRRFTRLQHGARTSRRGEARGGSPTRRRWSSSTAGRGQLSVAAKVLADLGLHIPHIGLAKRLEEVYFPGQPEPL